MVTSIAVLASGCGAPPSASDAGSDARPTGDAPPTENGDLQLGTGESDFTAITEGQTLLLARGCQGSQHVWISLHANPAFNARGVIVSLDFVRVSDGLRRSLEFLVRVSFTPESGALALPGMQLQVPDPEVTIGEELILVANIQDSAGRVAHATRRVRIAWGTETCMSF